MSNSDSQSIREENMHLFVRIAVRSVMVAVALAAGGCAPNGYVKTERLEVKSKTLKDGTQTVGFEKKIERAETNVIERSTNVKSVTKITAFDMKDKFRPVIGRFTLSPDGSRIVFDVLAETGKSFSSQLWGIGKNGGATTKITSESYQDVDPSFSSDGKHIYFATNRGDSNLKIWRVQSSGTGGLTKITGGSTADRYPSESASGENIVFQSSMDGDTKPQIWTSAKSGALPTQITHGESPKFSPDGRKILYCEASEENSNEREKSRIWLMDTDGSNRTQLTSGEHSDKWPSWSPDGTRVIFASNSGRDSQGQKNFDVYVMNIDGTGRTQLTTNGSADIHPVMDESGKNIYFVSNRGGAWNIWRMELAQ